MPKHSGSNQDERSRYPAAAHTWSSPVQNDSQSVGAVLQQRPEINTLAEGRGKGDRPETNSGKKNQWNFNKDQSKIVQRVPLSENELVGRAEYIKKNLLTMAPRVGTHLWKIKINGDIEIYILGTMHGPEKINKMEFGPELVDFLEYKHFRKVYTEHDCNDELSRLVTLDRLKEELLVLRYKREDKSSQLTDIDLTRKYPAFYPPQQYNQVMLDSLLAILATGGEKEKYGFLESHLPVTQDKGAAGGGEASQQPLVAQAGKEERDYFCGNEHSEWEDYANSLLRTKMDVASVEERNNAWIEQINGDYKDGPTLWIVGAQHVPGLLAILHKMKAEISSIVFQTRLQLPTPVGDVPKQSSLSEVD